MSSPASSNDGTTSKRRITRNIDGDSSDILSPPSTRRRLNSGSQNTQMTDPLFSSPPATNGPPTNLMTDMSSPLQYGTPSSNQAPLSSAITNSFSTPTRRNTYRQDLVRSTLRTVTEEQITETSQSEDNSNRLLIWGTDICVAQSKEKFKRFLNCYIDDSMENDELFNGLNLNEPVYIQRLREINLIGDLHLGLNCSHLKQFDEDLYKQLVAYPQELIPSFDMALNEMYQELFPEQDHDPILLRPFNVDKTTSMRSLNPEDIDQLITLNGMVIRNNGIVPEMREAFFQCYVCKSQKNVEIEHGRIQEPTLCGHCNTGHSFHMIHNRSVFGDKQMVKLQESPDDMPPGQTPYTVVVMAHGNLVDKVQPGDRVTVTGIYRASPLRDNPRQSNIKAVFKTHIDVVHYRKLDNRRLHCSDDFGGSVNLTDEKIRKIKSISQNQDIYESLSAALAPSIFENVDVKKGLLLQMFGGTRKDFKSNGRPEFRSDLNILLCGDPATSKSQLLQYVYKLMPRSQYTSGKGSSAVGLTAYITKDTETKQLVLQTGALVLADNGVCCIDEFDKMSDSARSVLHEVMEQQTLSIAKAGIICTMNARTSVLAAANPIGSQWDKNKTIVENIQLQHTLLSRFDLIFLLLDPQDEAFDRRLANHLVSLYYQDSEQEQSDTLDMNLLKDYLSYAKENIKPELSDEASQAFIESYLEMRRVGSGRGQISAYPRQLESLIRLAEAHAKMRLSNIVTTADVNEARRLHREALKQSAIDPTTGKIDVSILITGMSGAARRKRADKALLVKEIMKCKQLTSGVGSSVQYIKLYEEYRTKSIEKFGEGFVTKDMFDEILKDIQDDGEIVRTGMTVRLC